MPAPDFLLGEHPSHLAFRLYVFTAFVHNLPLVSEQAAGRVRPRLLEASVRGEWTCTPGGVIKDADTGAVCLGGPRFSGRECERIKRAAPVVYSYAFSDLVCVNHDGDTP